MAVETLSTYVPDIVNSGGTITFPYPSGRSAADYDASAATMTVGNNLSLKVGPNLSVSTTAAGVVAKISGLSTDARHMARLTLKRFDTAYSSTDAANTRRLTYRAVTAPNTFATTGTSRMVPYLDPSQRNKSNNCWLNWANGKLRSLTKPMIMLGAFAVSGYRTDQFAFATAIATGAANLIVDGPINSISQAAAGYTTVGGASPGTVVNASNVVAVALADLKKGIKDATDAGMRVFYVWERGANGFTSAQVGQLNDFNRRMADYLATGDDYRGVPNVVVLDPTPYTVTTGNASAIVLLNSADGTHDNVKAAKILGFAFADKIAPHLREVAGYGMRSLWQANSTLGTVPLNQNPGMFGSAAAAGTGNSGNVPNNWVAFSSTGVTAAFAIQATTADANGDLWGNEVKITATATQAGQVGMYLILATGTIATGDNIRAGLEIDVNSGATGLAAVKSSLEWYPSTGGTSPVFDMAESVGTDDGNYTRFQLMPDPLAIGAFTGVPYMNLTLNLVFSGAGSCVVTARKAWAERSA